MKIIKFLTCIILSVITFSTSIFNVFALNININNFEDKRKISKNSDEISNKTFIENVSVDINDGEDSPESDTGLDNSSSNNIVRTNSSVVYSINYAVGVKDLHCAEVSCKVFLKVIIDNNETEIKIDSSYADDYEVKSEANNQILTCTMYESDNNKAPCIGCFKFGLIPTSKMYDSFIMPEIYIRTEDTEFQPVSLGEVGAVKVVGNKRTVKLDYMISSKYKTNKISTENNEISGTVSKKSYSGEYLTGDIYDYLINISSIEDSDIGVIAYKSGDIIELEVSHNLKTETKDIKSIIYDIISEKDCRIVSVNPKNENTVNINLKALSDDIKFHILAVGDLNKNNYKNNFTADIKVLRCKINEIKSNLIDDSFSTKRDYLNTGNWVTYFSLLKYNDILSDNKKINNHLEMAYDDNNYLISQDKAHITGLLAAYKPMSAKILPGKPFFAAGNLYTKNCNESSEYKSFDYICFFDSNVIKPYTTGDTYVNNGDYECAVNSTDKTKDNFINQTNGYNGKNGNVSVLYIGRDSRLSAKEQVQIEIKDKSLTYYNSYDELLSDKKVCVGVCVSFRNGSIKSVIRKTGDRYLIASALTPLCIKKEALIDTKNSASITWTFAGTSSNLGNKTLLSGDYYEIKNPHNTYDYIASPMHMYMSGSNSSGKMYGIGSDKYLSKWSESNYDDEYVETTLWDNDTPIVPSKRYDESFDRYGNCVAPKQPKPTIKIKNDKQRNITNNQLEVSAIVDYSTGESKSDEIKNNLEINMMFSCDIKNIRFFINDKEINDFVYKNRKITTVFDKYINSKQDVIKVIGGIDLNCKACEVVATVLSKDTKYEPSYFDNTKDRVMINIPEVKKISIESTKYYEEIDANRDVEITNEIKTDLKSDDEIEILTFLSKNNDKYKSKINGNLLNRYIILKTSDLSDEEINSIRVTHSNSSYLDKQLKSEIFNFSDTISTGADKVSLNNISYSSKDYIAFELPTDTTVVKVSVKYNKDSKNKSLYQTVVYKDERNGLSIYNQNSYLLSRSGKVHIQSIISRRSVKNNMYNVKYVTDGCGKINGSSDELVEEGASPSGRDETATSNYIFDMWKCDKDVTLLNGEVILSQSEIKKEQIGQVVVKDNLTFTACYRLIPLLSVEKTSDKETYNSSETIIYTIKISQLNDMTYATNIIIKDKLQKEGLEFIDIKSSCGDLHINKIDKNSFSCSLERLDKGDVFIICKTRIVCDDDTENIFTSESADNYVEVICDEYISKNILPATSLAKPFVFHKIDVFITNGHVPGVDKNQMTISDNIVSYTKENIVSGADYISYYEPNKGFYLSEIYVDGNLVDKNNHINSYLFSSVYKNHKIEIKYNSIPDLNIIKETDTTLFDFNEKKLNYIITIKKDSQNRTAAGLEIEDIIEEGMIIDVTSIKVINIQAKYTVSSVNNTYKIIFSDDVVLDKDIQITYTASVQDKKLILKNHKTYNRVLITNTINYICNGIDKKTYYTQTPVNTPDVDIYKTSLRNEIKVNEENTYKITVTQINKDMIAKDLLIKDSISNCMEIIPNSITVNYQKNKESSEIIYKILLASKREFLISISNLSNKPVEIIYKTKAIKPCKEVYNMAVISSEKYNINKTSTNIVRIFSTPIKNNKIVKTGDNVIYMILALISCAVILSSLIKSEYITNV